MAVRALSLSGGAARGSFQLGALIALYEVYGFRPDVIAGTSVGAVNGILLAVAQPPAVNDPAAILASVAAGNVDSGLTAVHKLDAEWATFTSTSDLFSFQPAFKGSLVEDVLNMMNAAPSGEPPMSATFGAEIDKIGVMLSIPIVNFVSGPLVADQLQKLKGTILAVLTENAVFNMDPIRGRLNDPAKLTLADLAAGTPVFFATVALESGRLRYVDGNGILTERDGQTPVLSALMDSDVDAALDETLQPLGTDRKNAIKALSARYRAAIAAIQAGRVISRQTATTVQQRLATLRDMARNIERGNYFLDELGDQVRGLRLSTHVDPGRGVLASAAMPVFADPIVIGAERYVDAGIREIVPMEIAVRNGVTDIVGICCSSLELPRVDDMSNAGLADVGLRELTQIALQEVTLDDIAAARAKNITCTVIAPTFDVHGGTEVNESLIEISSAYGWMRAGDEMQPALDSARRDFRRLSDLIATFRIRSYSLERYIGENDWFVRAVETREPVATVRTYRWVIRELLTKRTELGLALHPQAQRWWRNWAREFRPLGPFGTVSVWSRLSAFSNNGTEAWVADGVLDPNTYAPDAGSLIDAGTDQVYWIVRGAVFLASNETEQTTTRTPKLAVPHATFTDLPRIPRGSHLIAEQDKPTEVWILRDGTRYRSTPALVTASGMAGQTVALVPPGGLAQIPDGGLPFWLGGLYVSDNLRHPVDRWEPTPQIEGSTSSTAVGLTNKTAQPIVVSGLNITSSQDGVGTMAFSVTTPRPLTVPPNTFLWVSAQFRPLRPGPITGVVSVNCNDPDVGQFAVPLATSATPLGPHGLLEVSPSSLDFGVVRAGNPAGQNVTLTNVGARDLGIAELRIVDSSPAGQFALPLSFPGQLTPGQSHPVYVSCTPTTRGQLTATLSAHVSSATDTPRPFEQRVDVPLAATAQAPVVLLAGRALPPLGPPLHPGPGFPLPHPGGQQLLAELTLLDFGAAAPGTTVTRTFWIRNVGDAPLAVTSVDTTSPGSFGVPDLSIFPAVVNPGGELGVEANFLSPAVAGTPAGATLQIQSDDPVRPRAELAVTGRTAGAHLSMQPAELLTLNSGSPPAGELVINSDGTDPVTLAKVGVDDHDFSLSGVPAPGTTLGPGASLTIAVSYTGMMPGQHDGLLTIAHDAKASQSRIFLRAFT